MNQHIKYLRQRSFSSTVIVTTDKHTDTPHGWQQYIPDDSQKIAWPPKFKTSRRPCAALAVCRTRVLWWRSTLLKTELRHRRLLPGSSKARLTCNGGLRKYVRYIVHCCQRRTERRSHVTCTENVVKFGSVVFETSDCRLAIYIPSFKQ